MCGLVGFSGTKKCDPNKIKFLTYANAVERDSYESTGFFDITTKTLSKGAIHPMYFMVAKEVPISTNMFGHVRKSTDGGNTTTNAHPHHEGSIVGVHNGTLDNKNLLAALTKTELGADESDSILIFRMLNKYKATNALRYMVGAAALIFTDLNDKEKPMYVYKLNERRSLHWGEVEGEGTYISSEPMPLSAIGVPTDKVQDFLPEVLYKIVKGKVEAITEIKPQVPVTTFTLFDARFPTQLYNEKTGEWQSVIMGYQGGTVLSSARNTKVELSDYSKEYNYFFQPGKIVELLNDWEEQGVELGKAGDLVYVTDVPIVTYISVATGRDRNITIYNPRTDSMFDVERDDVLPTNAVNSEKFLRTLVKTTQVESGGDKVRLNLDRPILFKASVIAKLHAMVREYSKESSKTLNTLRDEFNRIIETTEHEVSNKN